MFGHHGNRFGRGGMGGRGERVCDGSGRERHAWDGDERGRNGFGRHGGPFGGRGGRGGRFFEHGALRLVVLALLAERPRHGYEIIKDIEEKVGGAYSPSPGVVYPTLTLLEETGQIEVVASEGNKKLYGLTDAGRGAMAENRAQIDAILARMSAAAESRPAGRDPRLVRAVENFRLALHLKLSSDGLGPEKIAALAALLDETVTKIETL